MGIEELIEIMAKTGVAKKLDLVGVSLAEIRKMEAYFDLRFPEIYVQFLYSFGRSAGKLSDWTAIYFDDLKEIAEAYEFQQIMSDTPYPLKENALVFAHYDTHFDYIVCSEITDPPVYRVTFSSPEAQSSSQSNAPTTGTNASRDEQLSPNHVQFSASFSQYLEAMIRNAEKNKGAVEPFYIDECGNWQEDDLVSAAPAVE